MIDGEAIFLKTKSSLENCKGYWEKLLERDHLLEAYHQTQPLTLLSYQNYSINIENPKVTHVVLMCVAVYLFPWSMDRTFPSIAFSPAPLSAENRIPGFNFH